MNFLRIKGIIHFLRGDAKNFKTEEGRGQERTRRIALTAISGVFAKLIAMAVPLITVRITLNYMGEEIYGLWITTISLFTLFSFADFGLGNGLQTQLSKTVGLRNLIYQKKLISNTYIILNVIATLIIICFLVVYPAIPWKDFTNAQTEQAKFLSNKVVLAIVIPQLINVPLTIVQRTQMALQEGYKSYLWQCVGSILSLISIHFIASYDLGIIWMIWGSSLVPVAVSLVNMIIYFIVQRPELIPKIELFEMQQARIILKTGISFFALSLLTTLGLSLDSLIVANTSDLSSVTPFSISQRIVQLVSVSCTMLSMPLWAANGEALARGDYNWVKTNTYRIANISLAIVAFATVILVLFGGWFIKIWLGSDLLIPIEMTVGMICMQAILSYISPFFMVLNGSGMVSEQIALFILYTPISIVCKLLVSSIIGIWAIPWVGVFLYTILIAWPIYYYAKGIFNRNNVIVNK